ncbi:MAG: formate dehydrogenase accessory protein FdhE [Desulfobacca sp.]|uniref:formate dehydrogenase accessory protein FdhE n=1 Tax=Desulfobacca sp. TaxID=2067990 RepID=UPI0040498975
MPNPLPEQLAAALSAYKNAVPRRARLLDLAGAVLAVLKATAADLPDPPAADLPGATARLTAGQFLLPPLSIPSARFQALLTALWDIFATYDLLPPLPRDLLRQLLDLPPQAWLEEEGPAVVLARTYQLPAGLLLFIGQKALSPFYQQAAAPYAELLAQGLWQQALCPACGRPPTLALISPATGQRRLHCRLCDLTWPAPSRQACVFCGTEASQGRYYFLEDDPARRADLCQTCGRYLRTIVLAQLPHPLHLPLEELVLVDLDTLMAQRPQG